MSPLTRMSDVCAPLNHLLHGAILVLLTASLVTAGKDIAHQEVHDGMSKYIFVNGTERNCLPFLDPNYCAEGHQIEPCFHDNERDRCVPCSDGEEQLDKTYSDFRIPCYVISCPEGTIPGKRNPSSGCNLPCRCKNEKMVMNKDCSCQYVEVQCGRNTFLKNGICLPCPEGTHKPGNSVGPCVTKMLPLSDTSEPVTVTATPASSASEVNSTSGGQKNLTRTVTGKNVTNGDIAAEEKPPNHGSSTNQSRSILVVTIATLVAVLVVAGLSVAIIYTLCKRKLPIHSSAQPNSSNESLMQPQVAEVSSRGYTQVAITEDPPSYSSHGIALVSVNMEDEDRQDMAQPWTKDLEDQATGGTQADRFLLYQEELAEVTVHERDADETGRKEYLDAEQTPSVDQQDPNMAETMRKSNGYLDVERGRFQTLESTEQPNSVESVICKDPDDTSIKKRHTRSRSNGTIEALGENMEAKSLQYLGSAPSLNTDSFKSASVK